jgi:hypothetical protein
MIVIARFNDKKGFFMFYTLWFLLFGLTGNINQSQLLNPPPVVVSQDEEGYGIGGAPVQLRQSKAGYALGG